MEKPKNSGPKFTNKGLKTVISSVGILWRLQPGGEDQHFQYLTVNLYDDPVKMMSGAGDFDAAVKAAYPDMSEADLG